VLDRVHHGRVRLLVLRRELRGGRVDVVDEHHAGVDAFRDLTHQPVVRDLVAQDPAAAVEEHHERERLRRTLGTDDPDARRPRGPDGPRGVLDVGRAQRDGLRLQVGEHLVAGLAAHRPERRRVGDAVDEPLGDGLEAHGGGRRCRTSGARPRSRGRRRGTRCHGRGRRRQRGRAAVVSPIVSRTHGSPPYVVVGPVPVGGPATCGTSPLRSPASAAWASGVRGVPRSGVGCRRPYAMWHSRRDGLVESSGWVTGGLIGRITRRHRWLGHASDA
jgi:hypothetical protein